MKSVKIYISLAIFILLTAIKLTMPALAYEISDAITKALMIESEHTEAIIAFGESLAMMDIRDVFSKSEEKPEATELVIPKPSETVPTPSPTPEPEKNPELEAFIKQQSAFSEYDVPDNVTYEAEKLPFEYISPVSGVSSSGFGYRIHPVYNEVKYHYGTDFAANTGEKIQAFADGTIVAADLNDSLGKYVIIDHAEGYSTLYAHCSELCMDCGAVKKGDVIALVGETGLATGPHLHFELKHDELYLNPEFYV